MNTKKTAREERKNRKTQEKLKKARAFQKQVEPKKQAKKLQEFSEIRLLLTKPAIILADEPMAGLDKTAANLVFKCFLEFCEKGGSVIFSSHTHNFENAVQMELDGKGGLLIKT